MEFKVKPGQFSRTQIGATLTANGGRIHQPGATPYPSMFQPRSKQDTPQQVFANEHRFINISNPREILVYTDGACSRNGQNNPQAGCCFVHRPSAFSQGGQITHSGTICFPLGDMGPTGQVYKHTSNRAELRAVIAALQFRDWTTDCNRSWRSVVVATDSEYVAVNATERVQQWENKGWIAADGASPVKNQDLWKLLLSEIRKLQQGGVSVSFWRIPREWNERADKYAKQGATMRGRREFQRVSPIGPAEVKFEPYY
ncbi:ribonuclease H-like protein [Acephala macrosclerotiorum]|nr:ribonuclease H-like protein [Acephala macrosclerotiorum]